jgi:hypothetical protein
MDGTDAPSAATIRFQDLGISLRNKLIYSFDSLE